MARFVIVQGLPGSGKTTLTRFLATQLGIGYITKDDIKELLGDRLGIPSSKADNSTYGMAASDAQFTIIQSIAPIDATFIVESAYWADIASPRFQALANQDNVHLLQLYVSCDDTERARRFDDRVTTGARHLVHSDQLYTDTGIEDLKQRYRPLAIDGAETVYIDSTNATDDDHQWVAETVRHWIEQHEHGDSEESG